MKKQIFLGVIIAACAVIIIAFFMPWANVKTSVMGVSKGLTDAASGSLKDSPVAGKIIGGLDKVTGTISQFGDIEIKTTVRGYAVPVLVNNKTSRVALSLAQILFKSAEGVEWKSYLVYLMPLFGIVCALLAVSGLKNKIYIIIMVAIGGVIAIGGLYNLSTMDMANPVVKISIQKGLWYTMYAFLLIFVTGITWLAMDGKKA